MTVPLRRVPSANDSPSTEGSTSAGLAVVVANAATEPWAQERLYRDFVQWVGHVAASAGANEAELEDIVHDTFITAFASISKLASPDALKSWLARLTIRQVGRRRRWRSWLTLFSRAQDESLAWESLLDAASSPEVIADVRGVSRVLEQQPNDARLMWVLHRWHGLTLDETAEACEVSLATVKRRVARVDEVLVAWQENNR